MVIEKVEQAVVSQKYYFINFSDRLLVLTTIFMRDL